MSPTDSGAGGPQPGLRALFEIEAELLEPTSLGETPSVRHTRVMG